MRERRAVERAELPRESHRCPPLVPFRIYGWAPNPGLSIDDNMMDLLLIVTRNSTCREGSMGCILVHPFLQSPVEMNNQDETAAARGTSAQTLVLSEIDNGEEKLWNSIFAVANNRPLYSQNSSDIHAEVHALGVCARLGKSTNHCTAYITMAPCKNCLGALLMAGVKRIVYFQKTPEYLLNIAEKHEIVIEAWPSGCPVRTARVNGIVAEFNETHDTEELEEIAQRRQQRKKEKEERKHGKT